MTNDPTPSTTPATAQGGDAPGLIRGIHHITAISREPQGTMDFYTKVLGLRLVKLTVNFDDPGTYHYYFANAAGEPGTVLTFFPWPTALRGRQGTASVGATAFHIARGAMDFWRARLGGLGIAHAASERLGEHVLTFTDPDGMGLELIAGDAGIAAGQIDGSDVPTAMALRGFHSATLALRETASTQELMTQTMGFRVQGTEGNRTRLVAPGDATHASIVDLLHVPQAPLHKLGAGVVHHIAFRMRDGVAQRAWQATLMDQGYRVTDVADRDYFTSIYFREKGGVLFEFATDQPGFAIDEPSDKLGGGLMLPMRYEHTRDRLLQVLPRVMLPSGRVVGGAGGGA